MCDKCVFMVQCNQGSNNKDQKIPVIGSCMYGMKCILMNNLLLLIIFERFIK